MSKTAKSADGQLHSFPDDTPDAVIDKAMKQYASDNDDPGATAAFGIQTGRGLADALLSVPAAAGQVVAQGVAGTEAALEGGASLLTGGEFDFNRRANRNLNDDILGTLNNLPRPTANEIGAGVRSIPGLFGKQPITERFGDELANLEGDEAKLREQHPTATGAGDVAGDVASLFVGRQATGMEEKMRRFENIVMKGGKTPKPDILFGAANELEKIDPKAMKFLGEKVMNGDGWRKLLKGAGRSAEAGFEAVVLDVLHGDDPNETAAYVAGTQAAGSLSLASMKALTSGGKGAASVKLATAGVVTAGLWQMVKQATPGGTNDPIRSIKEGYEKVLLALAAGTVSGLAGAGRFRGPGSQGFQQNMPRLAEALTLVPRATVISLIEDMQNADPAEQKQAEAALQIISTEPDKLDPAIARALESALTGKKSFSEEVDKLMHDEEFAKLIFAITPPVLSNGN